MPLDVGALLQPIQDHAPCGPLLRDEKGFETLLTQSRSGTRVDWVGSIGAISELARKGHDLRVWIWLCRASMVSEGLAGLAEGLALIATGLEKYWDTLPPLINDETARRDRYLPRVLALTELGVTNFQVNIRDLGQSGRTLNDLRADLDKIVMQAIPNETTRAALVRCRESIVDIEKVFAQHMANGDDPQLGFDLLVEKLNAVERKFATEQVGQHTGATTAINGVQISVHEPAAPAQVKTRDDVILVLDLVLEFYETHEPSSPVPLLVRRAKRLVSMNFMDALKDLAPTGLKELQTVAGVPDDRK
ncbi:type VI secretion system protein ImpA [Skermanella aerolata]|uniref:type VI secretion system protein TssA n=1 Tax=Skermanella aerolata TaxID=393310 RepID=UPI003D1D0D9C